MPNWDERGSIIDHVFSAADMAPDAKGIPIESCQAALGQCSATHHLTNNSFCKQMQVL